MGDPSQARLASAGASVIGTPRPDNSAREKTQTFLELFHESSKRCEELKAKCREKRSGPNVLVMPADVQKIQSAVQGARTVQEFSTTGHNTPQGPATPLALKHLSLNGTEPRKWEPPRSATRSTAEVIAAQEGLADEVLISCLDVALEEDEEDAADNVEVEVDDDEFGLEADSENGGNFSIDNRRASAPPAYRPGQVKPGRGPRTRKDKAKAMDSTKTAFSQKSDTNTLRSLISELKAHPPALRFKTQYQFCQRFLPQEHQDGTNKLFEANKGKRNWLSDEVRESDRQISDPVIGWVNSVFEMQLETEYQVAVSYPIIVLMVLDSIYTRRVPWRKVDWRLQYTRALLSNYGVLETLWQDLNMDKAREFRHGSVLYRNLVDLAHAESDTRIELLKRLQRWWVQRIHHCPVYDPIAKRQELLDECKMCGFPVKFPKWIKAPDKEDNTPRGRGRMTMRPTVVAEKPEYLNLIAFLGNPDKQTL